MDVISNLWNEVKRSYCEYLTQLFFKVGTLTELRKKIDYIIDLHLEKKIRGDADLIKAIHYTIQYRKCERKGKQMVGIDNGEMFKIVYKSLIG